MKYLKLEERILKKDSTIGSWSGDTSYWVGYEPGAYLVTSILGTELVLWDGAAASALLFNSDYISDTEPKMGIDKVEKALISIKDKLDNIEKLGLNKAQPSSGIDGDILIKALAVAQDSKLIKDIL